MCPEAALWPRSGRDVGTPRQDAIRAAAQKAIDKVVRRIPLVDIMIDGPDA